MADSLPLQLATPRLLLVPIAYDFVCRVLAGDKGVYADHGITPVPGWPNADIQKILPVIRDNLEKPTARPGFESWLFLHSDTLAPVGDGGFKGPPNSYGVVELGYGILENERRKGYCTEATGALVEWGLAQPGVSEIVADCLEENLASQKVLQKLGMRQYSRKNGLLFYRLVG